MMKTLFGFRFVGIGAMVGALLGGAALIAQDAVARSDRTPVAFTAAGAPFAPLQPTRLPAGTTLVIADARTHTDGTTGDVDMFYALPNGSRLHIWQTNRSPAELGAKNPLNESGVVYARSLASWRALPGFDGNVLTLNALVKGRVISIDGRLTVDELLDIAESLR